MRFFVAGAMYRASGALFSTIETVAGEKPLDFATSLIVMVWFLPLCRFTRPPPAELSSGVCRSNCNVGPFTRTPSSYSGGASNDIVLRKPDVFHEIGRAHV